MAISTIGTDALAASAVTSTKLASGVPSRSQLPAGTVLQVVNSGYGTYGSTTSTSLINTGLSATITPTSSTSKILAIVYLAGLTISATGNGINFQLVRNGTSVAYMEDEIGWSTPSGSVFCSGTNFLDSPATTSALTYAVQWKRVGAGSNTIYMNNYNANAGQSVSYITLMEIAA